MCLLGPHQMELVAGFRQLQQVVRSVHIKQACKYNEEEECPIRACSWIAHFLQLLV